MTIKPKIIDGEVVCSRDKCPTWKAARLKSGAELENGRCSLLGGMKVAIENETVCSPWYRAQLEAVRAWGRLWNRQPPCSEGWDKFDEIVAATQGGEDAHQTIVVEPREPPPTTNEEDLKQPSISYVVRRKSAPQGETNE